MTARSINMDLEKRRILHPFLFAMYPILFLFSHNIAELSLIEFRSINRLVLPIIISLCGTSILWYLCYFFVKDKYKAAILVSLSLFMFFFYGHFYQFYSTIAANYLESGVLFRVKGMPFARNKLYAILWGILLITAMYFLRRIRRNMLFIFTRFLNILACILVILPLLNLIGYEVNRIRQRESQTIEYLGEKSAFTETTNQFPDIYYIILDEYAAASTLHEEFRHDNQEFLNYLRTKGFYVTSKSRSNYTLTILSLASSLNFEYVTYLSERLGKESKDLTVPIQMVKNSRVMRFLQSKGYKFIHFRSGQSPTRYNKFADFDISCERGSIKDQFVKLLIQTTVLDIFFRIYDRSYDRFGLKAARARIPCQFSMLTQVHNIEGPIFVLAHIVAPHVPYVFGAHGEEVPENEAEATLEPEQSYSSKGKQLYINQLIYINKRVKLLIDEIFSSYENPPIIILQGDHGTRILPGKEHLKAWTRILNAYYFPQGGDRHLYDSITPVNTFRILFNHYFHTNYELLDDQSYYSNCWEGTHYDFVNVTDRVKYN